MPVAASQPAVQVSDSDVDDDDQRLEEEEEVEVEEEEEEEEEDPSEDDDDDVEEEDGEEDEEDEDEEEDEEPALDSPTETDDDHKDVRHNMKSQENDGPLESASYTKGKFGATLPSNTLDVEESSVNFKLSGPSKEAFRIQSEELCAKSGKYLAFAEKNGILLDDKKGVQTLLENNSSKQCSKLHSGRNSHLCNSETMDAKIANSSGVIVTEVAVSKKMSECCGIEANILDSEDKINEKDKQSGDNKKQIASRLASDMDSQSLSAGADINDGNKRQAITCDFFAKGWCIKGSSCRFLHVKDNLNIICPQHEGEVAAVNRIEVQLDEGVRDTTERSRSPSSRDLLAPLAGDNSAFSAHFASEGAQKLEQIKSERRNQFLGKHDILSLQKEEFSVSTSLGAEQLDSSRGDSGFPPLFKDVGRERKRQNWAGSDCDNNELLTSRGDSVLRNSLHPKYGFPSSGCTMVADKYSIGKSSSHSSSFEEIASIQSHCMRNYPTLPPMCHSLYSSSSNPLLNNNMLSSNHISARNASSLPFSYPSLLGSSLGSRSSSFLRSSSSMSGSEPENLPSTSISLVSAELKRKFSSNDWEPSVPFRPSFFIPPAISSPGSQYDPLCDSFELPKMGDVSFRAFYGQGSSMVNMSYRQTHGDSVKRTLGLASNDDINSVSSHNAYNKNVLDKSCHTREKDMLANEAEAFLTSVGSQNETTPKEEIALELSDVGDNIKTDKNSDGRHQRDGSKYVNVLKVDRIRQNNEEVDCIMDETMPKEENALELSDVGDNINSNKITDGSDGRHQRDGSRHIKHLKVDKVIQHKEQEVDCIMGGESKAPRQFRAALVDLVKELLKPKWREGNLSKDAHNKIVKKAVEKVLNSAQHHQVPTTMESVKQYLLLCRPKIIKLVEGYADKYGKT